MFTIRSKVQNTPIPSYASYNNRRSRISTSDDDLNRSRQVSLNTKKPTTKRKRKKKRRASEININDYPSAKRFMFVFLCCY